MVSGHICGPVAKMNLAVLGSSSMHLYTMQLLIKFNSHHLTHWRSMHLSYKLLICAQHQVLGTISTTALRPTFSMATGNFCMHSSHFRTSTVTSLTKNSSLHSSHHYLPGGWHELSAFTMRTARKCWLRNKVQITWGWEDSLSAAGTLPLVWRSQCSNCIQNMKRKQIRNDLFVLIFYW